ncbi:lipoyl synthase [Candidatus Marinimicrobia bacterium]|jgi:lipoic acid synthetase|nr:lipoyl synthase [Candidatus Neomarinimicrobiota bacterium]MDC0878148.1 lipoyl synthase [Candidatus Neomarinimicrobiota bacterium]MDC1000654.1 lipoyl synthase [Candidatus Neomarinimicrobiota bacterium]MDC1145576.1 lipoyl synthase [Candidatus Neomarinimicrobiota bacterium]MDC3287942.1 lipoyl synthase [Candidatus Neomarinimicrobiota bacterium]|tara:strand:+ start:10222 stop:11088 length:867 start_codon:yes stop_codon:yes gene_type:complete
MIQTGLHKPKINITTDENYKSVKKMVQKSYLNTVCAEARCPNIYECWSRKTATLMILGDTCTRGCGFCSIKTGRPTWDDPLEPYRVAQAVQKMQLRHVVITSVDRDDLKGDYGSSIWAQTINTTRKLNPKCTIEVLTPDFQGDKNALKTVFDSKPDIFSHNVECVERISKGVRAQANWQRSLDVLKESINYGLRTKTGIMVGLGETEKEVKDTMKQIVDLGVQIFTIGQYLQPTKKHLKVEQYVPKEKFDEYKIFGESIGFKIVESGPLVRSSYRADEQARTIFSTNE